MDHTHIVQASDLDRYAATRDSQAVIPELVYWLVKQSCQSLAVCRIPYGDAVNQRGWDGLVESENSFHEYVPAGKSYWEIGTGTVPQKKATKDFTKRTVAMDKIERANSSFVFVTPRSSGAGGWDEPKQTKWLNYRKNKGWKHIQVIDGVKLADWLREFPAIGKWMATKIPLTVRLGGISTPMEHWSDLVSECATNDPPYPSKLFTVGRTGASEALQALFEGQSHVLKFFAESPQDVEDFVAAFLAGLDPETSRIFSNKCLYINDEQAWRSIVETRSPHVLVASSRLGLETDEGAALQTLARRKGHAVIVPLCGAWSGNSPEILKLRSPSPSQIEVVLKEAGYPGMRAQELSRIGGDRLSALRRHVRGYGTLPSYATWDNAALMAQAGLIGKWDGSNLNDRTAIEILLGKKDYGEWIETLRPDTLRSDSPLIQQNEKWRIVARGEAWNALGNRITDDDLSRFQEAAIAVLSEKDPKFELPKEDRFAASIHGKTLSYSNLIRQGIAEALALMGSRSIALSSCSEGKPELAAILVVRRLLKKADWERWASLDSFLPLLAEAAPDEFLDTVESVLVDLDKTPFHRVFAEEGSGGIDGWNYMSGLLWALETLAWNADFLSRVSVILADIASIDPGGNWLNRPANSLVDIFLPWHVQTTAPFNKRKSAIEAVIMEQPTVGWKLLMALLPHNHGMTSGCHRPIWRDYIARGWTDKVTNAEYWDQIITYTQLACDLAKNDPGMLSELIERLPELPKSASENMLNYLKTEASLLSEVDRLPLWENLDRLARRHRKYSDATWALPEDAIRRVEETALALEPKLAELKHRHIFSDNDFDLYDEKGNYEEQRRRLAELRQNALSEILGEDRISSVMKFATSVAAPNEVGRALGVIASNEIENEVLPSLLDSQDNTEIQVIAGFIWARYWNLNMDWVDALLKRDWSPEQQAKFLIFLPFEEEIWKRVGSHLRDANEALYWKSTAVNPYGPNRNLTIAIEKLLKYGREGAAAMCVAATVDDKSRFDESLAIRALLAALESENGIQELDQHRTVAVIKRLQDSATADKNALFRIEWNFLPWLDRFSSGAPVTLETRLASDPAFFAELIGLVFRSKNTSDDVSGEVDERKKQLAKNGYRLLSEWRRCPGIEDDGSFNAVAFKAWLNEVRRITEESGHAEVAQIQIGHVLTCAPSDPDGLWIHHTVAEALNFRDTGEMRSGFTTQLFNDRGVHGFTYGKEEREIAKDNREKAEALENKGYTRFATAMREFAEHYERIAECESNRRGPFDD